MKLTFTEPRGSVRQRARYLMQNRTFRLIMRVSYINIFFLTLSLKLLAFDSYAQGMEETYVTLEFTNAPLKKVFEEIEKQTEFIFVFSPEKLDGYPRISFPKGRYTVKEAMDKVLEGTDLKYEQKNKYIVISLPDKVPVEPDETSEIRSQETTKQRNVFTVTGKITDGATQQPLAGVNIIVKGTTRGTTSDADGRFAIDAEENEVLVFSFIGFKTFETQVGERTTIDIVMEGDATALSEVEVRSTGYWTEAKDNSVGNIAKISSKEIENQPVTSPLMALQGRVAGLEITPSSGMPGNAPIIRIRGTNSLRNADDESNGNFPLYVIDGIPVNSTPLISNGVLMPNGVDPLSTIDPSNIESIEILKDGDATAIYGSRGANGVILITTKRGSKPGKTRLDLSFYKGVGQVSQKLDLLNTEQFVAMRKEAYKNDGINPAGFQADDLLVWDTTRYTDWQEVLLGGTANITDAQLNISGGNGNTFFRFGGGFHKETMVFPGDFEYQRGSGHLSVDHVSPNRKFIAGVSINYGIDHNRLFNDANLVNQALILAPHAPALYNEDGSLNWEYTNIEGYTRSTWTNPLSLLLKTHEATTGNLVAASNVSYEVLPGLQLKASLAYNELNGNEHMKVPIASEAPDRITSANRGSADFGTNKRSSWIIEPQLTYVKEWSGHRINAIAGTTFQRSTNAYQIINATGYTTDALLESLQGAAMTTYQRDEFAEYKYSAVYGRIGYGYNNKYLLNVSVRRDGSSRFGPGNKWGNFGAVGIGWIFSREGLLKNSSILTFGKLRASYGTTGNDQIGDYRYYNLYRISEYTYQGATTLSPEALFNPDFAWEITKKLEAAMELRLLKDRLSLDVSWYRNRSSNQLINYSLPATTGFQTVLVNRDATVENTGLEILMAAKLINSNNISWSASVNITMAKNKLVEFPDIENSSYAKLLKVGESLSIQRLYTWIGVNPQTGRHEFLDVNEDGIIDDNDKQFMNGTDRGYYGGLTNSLRYKAFELVLLFQFSSRPADKYNAGTPGIRSNQQDYVLDRWQQDGDITGVQKFARGGSVSQNYNNRALQSNYKIDDASFIRLKTLSLSYTLPSGFLSKAMIGEAKIFVQGQNLFTITDYANLDPETGSSLPPLRMLTAGVQLKF